MNSFQRYIANTFLGMNTSNGSVSITGKEIADASKVQDPGAKFVRPYHLRYSTGHKAPQNVTFYQSEYDLYTIANAIQLDGILNRSVSIFKEQILKNGFECVSKDDKVQQHTRARLREIEILSGIKFKETVASIAQQLVTYGNAYVIKVRKNISKYGKSYRLYNKQVKPIVGLFLADATTMKVGLKNNKITHYEQEIKGERRNFYKEDVIHFTYNKIPGTLTGCSNINMILDDLRALRKLEEEIEILGFQYAIPLYLYQVGTDTHPAVQGEIDTVSNAINNMPTFGIMCVPHTHDMKAVSNNNDPVDVMKFVEHFKKRIFSGLGISPVSMGDTNCYSEDTLTLTENGWKYFTDIDHTTTKIATYNPDTKGIEYHVPNSCHIQDYTGEMVHFYGKHVDTKVTPNHEMWVMIRHSGERKKVFAKDLLDKKYPEFCFIDKVRNTPGGTSFISLDKKTISIDNLLQLAGWYVSEGCLDVSSARNHRYRTIICQKGLYVSDIRLLLNSSKLSFSEKKGNCGVTVFTIYGKDVYHFMQDNFGHLAENKYISNKFKNLSINQANILLSTMMKGDGYWDSKSNTGQYYTTSEQLKLDVIQLAIEAGYQTKYTKPIDPTPRLLNDTMIYPKYPVQRISITNSTKDYRILTPKHVTSEFYSGKIYCYNVPNHLFITMRNGKVAIHGNTSNRNTSEIADTAMQNITKSYQQIISNKIEQELLVEFLYDGRFNPYKVDTQLRFGEIDLEAQIKKETNILQKYQGNLITMTEARLEGDYEPKVEEKDLYINKVQIPLIREEGAIQEKVASIGAKAAAAKKASENKVKSNSKPTNQHGTSSGRPKIKRDFIDSVASYTHTLGAIFLSDDGYKSKINRDTYMNKVSLKIKFGVRDQLVYTIDEYKKYYHLDDITIDDTILQKVSHYYTAIVQNRIDNLTKITGTRSAAKLNYSLDSIKDMISSDNKIENLAKIIILRNNGYSSILYNADNCLLHSKWSMNVDDFSINEVPPLRRECKCTIEEDNELF